ncbi:MAG: lipopolysaccharide heptosyltransferase II [Syntrophales bacterium]|nr:lipopolysaccharide heptosyltransferase II [Syntrophales bacterium]
MKTIIKSLYLWTRYGCLKIFSLLLPGSPDPISLQKIHKILFIRTDRIGDMVLSTPAFAALKKALPQAELTVLASPANAAILQHNPTVDSVQIYDRHWGILKKIRFLKQLRIRRFDLAIDPGADYEMHTAWLAFLSGAAHRLGYAAYGREVLFNVPPPKSIPGGHFVDIMLALLSAIGIPAAERKPKIYISAAEQRWAITWLEEKGLGGRKIIGIHPGAHYPTQRWPAEYYAELIKLIRREPSAAIIVFGSPADRPIIKEILSDSTEEVVVAIQDDLRKLSALLACCRMVVCNNSGPLHIAVALGIPTISFIGPTIRDLWMPIGEGHRVLRRNELSCIGCNLGYCKIKTHDCMRLIKPEEVIRFIREMIS